MFEVVKSNKIKSSFIVILVFVLLSVIVYFLADLFGYGGTTAVVIALVFSVASVFASYFWSDKIVLASCHARPADPETEKQVTMAMEALCIASGMPMPGVYVVEDSAPNAFATGRNPQHAVICVTRGLLDKLNYYELEGVLAHELSHIKNYDILLSTIVSVMVGMIVMISDMYMNSCVHTSRHNKDDDDNPMGGILMIFFIILMILAPLIGQLMQLALSRRREYLADASAIEMTRNPQGLIDALIKISDDDEILESANKATANMYICNPLKGEGFVNNLFSTHPPINERIEALKNIH